MSLKARVDRLEAAQFERELERCARSLAAQHPGVSVAEVRREIEEILARRGAGGLPPLSPEERQQATALRREMEAWERSHG